jgi:hypothetical protein
MTTEPDTTTSNPENAEPEALAEAGRKALDAERKARKEAEQRARAAEQRLVELEQAEAERRAEAELADLRAEVASEKHLTAEQAKRLVGTTKEELEADADELKLTFGVHGTPASKPRPNLKGGTDPTADRPPDASAVADRILGNAL